MDEYFLLNGCQHTLYFSLSKKCFKKEEVEDQSLPVLKRKPETNNMNLNKNLLCLKWDDFDNFVVSGLSNLYQKDDMSDTTLFCDGRSFKAHKIVLSIWSSYFREIFGSTTHVHPVVVLRETTSSDLELILRFIYQGQLFVPFEDTERFLKTAEYFQIAGLRDMRVHLSTSAAERNQPNSSGNTLDGGNYATKSSSGPTIVHPSTNHATATTTTNVNGSSLPLISPQQSFQNPSYASTSMASIDGIPVQILSSSIEPPTQTQTQLHTNNINGHPNSVNPIPSIINTNNSGGLSSQQFSTNVIKPIPSRQPNRLHQQQPPLLLSSTNTGSSNYGHNLSNSCSNRQGSQELMYSNGTQPILVVQQQKQSQQIGEYHHHHDKMLVEDSNHRSEHQLLVFERVGGVGSSSEDNRKISTMDHHQSLGSGMNETISVSMNHQEDESEHVLGLPYNNSSSNIHSHIIRETAVAGTSSSSATEDTEIIEMDHHHHHNHRGGSDSSTFTSSSADSIGKLGKINNHNSPTVVVLTPSPSTTPVYAVKRVPSHPITTTSCSSETPPKASSSSSSISKSVKSTTTATTPTNKINSNKVFKSSTTAKTKRQRRMSCQNSEIEFVNCTVCDKRVKKTSLKVHIKRTHLEEGTILICPICGKQISSKGVYYKHMYGHRQKTTDTSNNKQPNNNSTTSKSKEESRP